MSKTRAFEVSLIPLDPFFFGGEKSFYKDHRQNASQEYYVHGNLYPQQTTLLGAMRYVLLEQNGLLPVVENKVKATQLIGPKSFDMSELAIQEFGIIETISPIFLKNDNGWLRVSEKSNNKGKALTLEMRPKSEAVIVGIGQKSKPAVVLNGYNAKDGIQKSWTDSSGNVVLNDDVANQMGTKGKRIFVEAEQVGIQKLKETGGEEAFYKQVFTQLSSDVSFVFQILLREHDEFVFERTKPEHKLIQLHNSVITMGGERSAFYMKITEVPTLNFSDYIKILDKQDAPKLVLLSDAIIALENLSACRFVLADTIDFRQLKSSVERTDFYYRRSRDGKRNSEEVSRSNKFTLLERGAVFYFNSNEEMDEVEQILQSHPAYQIGYNHYHSIKKMQ